jgi:hypothetical protein
MTGGSKCPLPSAIGKAALCRLGLRPLTYALPEGLTTRFRPQQPEPDRGNHAGRIINASRYRSKPAAAALLEKAVLLFCAAVAPYRATRL